MAPIATCSIPVRAQIRDLNSGTFGFVELALDKTTGQQVAIKFIERGDKVRTLDISKLMSTTAFTPPSSLSALAPILWYEVHGKELPQ